MEDPIPYIQIFCTMCVWDSWKQMKQKSVSAPLRDTLGMWHRYFLAWWEMTPDHTGWVKSTFVLGISSGTTGGPTCPWNTSTSYLSPSYINHGTKFMVETLGSVQFTPFSTSVFTFCVDLVIAVRGVPTCFGRFQDHQHSIFCQGVKLLTRRCTPLLPPLGHIYDPHLLV